MPTALFVLVFVSVIPYALVGLGGYAKIQHSVILIIIIHAYKRGNLVGVTSCIYMLSLAF